MPATITKGQIVRAVAGLPEDATVDDAIERLLFLSKIEQGLEQAQRGETIPHEEVKRRIEAQIASWQK
jgi:predicted transcriptional regulator